MTPHPPLEGDGSATSDEDRVECRICGGRYRSLGHHLPRAHGMTPDDYRDRHGIRRGDPLTAPTSRQRWQANIGAQIDAGTLDEHYARNPERSRSALPEAQRVLSRLREAGTPRRPSRPARARDHLVAIVTAIETGTPRAEALATASISEGHFYDLLRRHPDLKARMAQAAEQRRRRSPVVGTPSRGDRSELGRIVTAIHDGYPRASLLYARIAIALIGAPGRTLSVSDLSDRLGRGRDSSAVQSAVARLDAMGLVSRELQSAGDYGGRAWAVTLKRRA